jgi:hypothetical protein
MFPINIIFFYTFYSIKSLSSFKILQIKKNFQFTSIMFKQEAVFTDRGPSKTGDRWWITDRADRETGRTIPGRTVCFDGRTVFWDRADRDSRRCGPRFNEIIIFKYWCFFAFVCVIIRRDVSVTFNL